MKNVLIFSIISIALLSSCQKDGDQEFSSNNSSVIIYKDSLPAGQDTLKLTIDTVVPTNYCVFPNPYKLRSINYTYKGALPTYCQSIPSPTDSTASIFIDMNCDSINDFIFTANHWEFQGSGSGWTNNPCWRYENNKISLRGIDTIARYQTATRTSQTSIRIGVFQEGDTIWQKDNYISEINNLYLNSRENQILIKPNKNKFYIGVELMINREALLGWILIELVANNGIQIKESALNTKVNSIIIAGK